MVMLVAAGGYLIGRMHQMIIEGREDHEGETQEGDDDGK